jgi:hypothetical protein
MWSGCWPLRLQRRRAAATILKGAKGNAKGGISSSTY